MISILSIYLQYQLYITLVQIHYPSTSHYCTIAEVKTFCWSTVNKFMQAVHTCPDACEKSKQKINYNTIMLPWLPVLFYKS